MSPFNLVRKYPILGVASAARHSGRAVWMVGGKVRHGTLREWEREEALTLVRAVSRIAFLFGAEAIPVPMLIAMFGERYVHNKTEDLAGAVYDWLRRHREDQPTAA